MKVLGIESSGIVASVAICEDDVLKAEYTLNNKKTHSQTLLPMLDEIVTALGMELDEIDYIASSKGPGSFTGLRIGAASAKGIALALKKDIIPVPTVDALAFNVYEKKGLIVPMMDARREQVYTGIYEYENGEFCVRNEQFATTVHEIIEKINEIGKEVTFLGDGVIAYREIIEKECKVPFTFAPMHLNMPRAGSVAALGIILAKRGTIESAAMHRPEYLRLTQAERERMEKLKSE